MLTTIGCISQKGGVGKSTLARLIATEYARQGWRVLVADLDTQQATCTRWAERRQAAGVEPHVEVQAFHRVDPALRAAVGYDLLVFDGAPHASTQTGEVAQRSNLVLLPTGLAVDDLVPAVQLAHELVAKGVPAQRLAVCFVRVGDSESELAEASDYIARAGYRYLSTNLPERTGYRRASDLGRAATETAYPTLNHRADALVQAVVDLLEEVK